ncbi:Kynurenine formamidase [Tulasnella sp. 418]|nr:Kynurenine formamidase [Tulasnella sp. 418]
MTETDITAVELSYGAEPLHKVDIYYVADVVRAASGNEARPPLLVFIHGGAWRSGDKSEYPSMAKRLVHITGCTVAVANYRLSPRQPTPENYLHHPSHARDVADALEYLVSMKRLPADDSIVPFDNSRVFLAGHSCGAHILCSLFLKPQLSDLTIELSNSLLSSVKGIVITEGIYDVDLLLATFPTYIDFIQGAFGEKPSYTELSPTAYTQKERTGHIHWLVIQSPGDTLIDMAQATAVYTALVGAVGEERVSKDVSTLTQNHFELLHTDEFAKILAQFIATLR